MRKFLSKSPFLLPRLTLMGSLAFFVICCMSCQSNQKSAQNDGWSKLDAIKKNIVPPTFADKQFSILDYGGVQDSTADALPAITKAIDACSKNEDGGTVIVPAGVYFVKGPIHLKSHVELHLDKGAKLKFSTDPKDFLPVVFTRYEGVELMNYSPLIYAYGQEDIALTGEGILDGQASNENWWNWTGAEGFGWKEGMPSQENKTSKPALEQMNKDQIPVKDRIFGAGHYIRPSFVEFYNCKNILIKGVKLINSPFWVLHPTLSQNITIDSVTTVSYGPNNDGCDPESCTDVWIKNCFFSNGDDCIAIKSGRNEDGRRINVPSKNIIVENCHMEDGHGGVVIGSEASGGVEDVYAQNCEMNSPNLDRAIRIKSNACRGGEMRRFYFRNIEVGQVHEAVVKINMFYGNEKDNDCHYTPTLDSVFVSNVRSHKSEFGINFQGREDKPVTNIFVEDCTFDQVAEPNIIKNVQSLTIKNSTVNGQAINTPEKKS